MSFTPIEKDHIYPGFEISGPMHTLAFLFPEGKPVRYADNGVSFVIGLHGSAWVEIDGKNYPFQRGTFLCLTPGHLLCLHSSSCDLEFEYLFFEYDFLSDFPLLLKADISDKMGRIPALQLDTPSFHLLTRYYDFIVNRWNSETNQPEITKGLLFSLVLEISRIYSGQDIPVSVSRKNELAEGFFRLLHKHCKQERTTTFYAGQLCITDKYLSRVIKEVTGQTCYFWISDFIIKEAKLLLKSTQLSVTEIAERLKFPNSSFFARFFRQHTGMSPLQFRKEK